MKKTAIYAGLYLLWTAICWGALFLVTEGHIYYAWVGDPVAATFWIFSFSALAIIVPVGAAAVGFAIVDTIAGMLGKTYSTIRGRK